MLQQCRFGGPLIVIHWFISLVCDSVFSFDNRSRLTLLLCPAVPQMVVKTYMDMDQDSEEEKQQYLGLALHLASEFFLRNPNKDVRLLVACCLADIFRIYAPEAPYTSHDKLKVWNRFWTAAYN